MVTSRRCDVEQLTVRSPSPAVLTQPEKRRRRMYFTDNSLFPENMQPVFASVGSWTRSMAGQRTRGWLIVVLLSLLIGCSTAPRTISFQHNYHRQPYSFNEEDLKKLQFYISTDVVAQYQDTTGTKSLLVPRLTPGVVTSAGPNWLRVSFRDGGVDVPFITNLNQGNGWYWIATEVEGSTDFKKIAELPEKSFLYKGTRYTLVSGADAYLLVDWEGWGKLVATRKVTEGRQVR
jgi:hypothetical protein